MKQSGMVLITTILIIMVLSLLVLSQMQQVFLHYKAFNQLSEKQRAFFQLETAANKLMTKIDFSTLNSCMIAASEPNEVIRRLKNKQGCVTMTSDKQPLYYLIEELGVFPCLQTTFNKTTYSTHHHRISLLSFNLNSAVLQLRVARPTKLAPCEHQAISQSQLGVLSWRYIKE